MIMDKETLFVALSNQKGGTVTFLEMWNAVSEKATNDNDFSYRQHGEN